MNSTRREIRFIRALPLIVLLTMLFLPLTGQAQVLYGSITGNVTDTAGAALPGATVTITHKETGQTRQGVTDVNGAYDFPNVLAGTYTVKVTKTDKGNSIEVTTKATSKVATRS